MNGIAEVRHILRKDVAQTRWLLVSFIALVLVSTWRGSSAWFYVVPCVNDCHAAARALDGILGFVVFIFGLILTAALIQNDSTQRFDAFWKLQPARSSSILLAKIVILLVVVGVIQVTGQIVALRALGFDVTESWRPVLASSRFFFQSVASVALIASVTRDLREFALTLVGLIIATLVLLFGVMSAAHGNFLLIPYSRPLTFVVSILVDAALLVWLFHVRTPNRFVRVATVALSAIIAIKAAQSYLQQSSGPDIAFPWSGQHAKRAEPAAMSVHATLEGRSLSVWITTHAPTPGSRLRLVNPILQIESPNGKSVELTFPVAIPAAKYKLYRGASDTNDVEVSSVTAFGYTPSANATTTVSDSVSHPGNRPEPRREVVAFEATPDTAHAGGVSEMVAKAILMQTQTLADSELAALTEKGARIVVSGFIEVQNAVTLLDLPTVPALYQQDWKTNVRVSHDRVSQRPAIALQGVTMGSEYNPRFTAITGNMNYLAASSADSAYLFVPDNRVEYWLVKDGGKDTLALDRAMGGSAGSIFAVLPSYSINSAFTLLSPERPSADDANFLEWIKAAHVVAYFWRYQSHALARAETRITQR